MTSLGFIFGVTALAFAFMAHLRINKLEQKLKDLDVLDKDFKSGDK